MIISVRIQPRASRTLLKRAMSGEWKLYVSAPPVEGRANEACIEFFSRLLRIPASRVRIVSGHKSRNKVIELVDVGEETLAGRCNSMD